MEKIVKNPNDCPSNDGCLCWHPGNEEPRVCEGKAIPADCPLRTEPLMIRLDDDA